MPEEAPGCSIPHLTLGEGSAWSWHRAYRDVFTASFDGHPGVEFDIHRGFNYRKSIIAKKVNGANLAIFQQLLDQFPL